MYSAGTNTRARDKTVSETVSPTNPMKPSLVDIRCALTAATAFADLFAESHPQHAEAVAHFIGEIRTISKELGDAIYGEPASE